MKPMIYIDHEVYQKIMFWVQRADGEVSGLGKVRITEHGNVVVTSAILVKQENTGTSTEMDGDEISRAMYELRNEPGELRFWWHSHVNMNVFWSTTDTDTMQELGQHGWIVATVFNKKNEYRSAIYQGKPLKLFVDELPTYFTAPLSTEQVDKWTDEFEKKCRTKKYESKTYTWPAQSKTHVLEDKTLEEEQETESDNSQPTLFEGYGYLNDIPESERPVEIDDKGWVTLRDGTFMHKNSYFNDYGADLDDPETQIFFFGATVHDSTSYTST